MGPGIYLRQKLNFQEAVNSCFSELFM
ncbi:hypothetical protein NC651_004046 [Populus alba x Populus x berolinensis]|nr:hypothetical protein NC651_004046 [Populus alba x Populus x berolinensis]